MRALESYLSGSWTSSAGAPAANSAILVNPATEAPIASVPPATGLAGAVAHGRDRGGPALRALNFRQRGALLADLAKLLHGHREALLTSP